MSTAPGRHFAKVTSTDPLTVQLHTSSSSAEAGRCATYTPTDGDTVLVLEMPGDRLLIIDRVVF